MATLTNTIQLGEVGLKVSDLNASVDFYHEIIGLDILTQGPSAATLGIDGKALVALRHEPAYTASRIHYPGLYHVAILVPDEKDLGQLLIHFVRKGFGIDGAGDHVYSQALYMHDPDGHGIEIYADRDRSLWKVNADGTIETGTFSVDVERLLSLVDEEHFEGLPSKTKVGHFHLEVNNVDKFKEFFVDTLGMEVKTRFHGALFVSKDGYHHHIAGNAWARPAQDFLPDDIIGIDYYSIRVDNYDEMRESLQQTTYLSRDVEDGFMVQDGNGIWLKLVRQ